jgi:predicted dehydrogenase
MKSAIDNGVIGPPVLGFAEMIASYGVTPPDDTWYSDPELCPLAPLFRIGCYKLNTFGYLLGPAAEVFAFEARRVTQRPTVDTVVAQVRYQNGALVQIQSSLCVGGRACGPFIQIGGPEGTLAFASDRNDELVLRVRKQEEVLARASEIGDGTSWYDYECFQSLVREGKDPEIPLSLTLDVLAVFEAAVESARTGKPVKVVAPAVS